MIDGIAIILRNDGSEDVSRRVTTGGAGGLQAPPAP